MISRLAIAALAVAVVGCGPTHSSGQAGKDPPVQSLADAVLPGAAKMAVTSPAIRPDGTIGRRYGADGDNLSPPISWPKVDNAKSYAVVVQDSDSPGHPFVHWLIWNIPATRTALQAGITDAASLDDPHGASQGVNDNGGTGWFGPHPPVGDPPHHYHLQVFALDGPLGLAAGGDLPALLGAMRGHIVAAGETVGTFARTKT